MDVFSAPLSFFYVANHGHYHAELKNVFEDQRNAESAEAKCVVDCHRCMGLYDANHSGDGG